VTSTAERYRRFAREAAGRSAVYARWARDLADDAEAMALIDTLPVSCRQPVLILTAARFTGLSPSGDARAWLEGEWDAVEAVARTRATQTNDPRRSSALVAALDGIHEPIALLEVGASVGLGLLVDRYRHRFWRGGEAASLVEPVDDDPETLDLDCQLGDGVPAPTHRPDIVWRAGLERRPLSLGTADDERWLRTLIWPEERDRARQLDAALRIAHAHPPRVVAGDAVDGLRAAVTEMPDDVVRVIWSPAVLVYLAPEARARFVELARELSDVWMSLDGRRVLPAVAERAAETLPGADDDFLLSRDGHPLAIVSPHGDRIERWTL
jgi:hypothetical protein